MPKNKSMDRIEAQLAQLQPGTLRYEALESAKRFKRSWVDLGRVLWSVYKRKHFQEWGYLTFDAYCSKEVGIRAATAKKLLQSYYFLEKEEPTTLRRITEDDPAQLPSADSVNMLRLLKKRPQVSEETYNEVRTTVLDKAKEPAEVRRQVRTALEQLSGPSEIDPAQRRKLKIRKVVTALKAARYELSVDDLIPKKLLKEVAGLIQRLEDLL